MAAGLGSIAGYLVRDAPRAVEACDAVVKPLIDEALAEEPQLCQDTYYALLATAVRVNLALRAYAAMAGLPFDVALSVLGAAFTRVYQLMFAEAGHMAPRATDGHGAACVRCISELGVLGAYRARIENHIRACDCAPP